MLPHNDEAIIVPRKGRNEASLPKTAFMIFTQPDLDFLVRRLGKSLRKTHALYLSNVYEGPGEQTPAVVGPLLGAPQSVMVLERLIALGVRNIVALGWCGSVQPHVKIADLVMPTGAVSEEGTSTHYPIDTATPGPSPELFSWITDKLADCSPPIHTGLVWTTDAPFRETRSKILEHQGRGVLAVEMETSALFTVARFRQVDLASAMVVSDDLSTLRWQHGFHDPCFRRSRESLLELVLRAYTAEPDLPPG